MKNALEDMLIAAEQSASVPEDTSWQPIAVISVIAAFAIAKLIAMRRRGEITWREEKNG